MMKTILSSILLILFSYSNTYAQEITIEQLSVKDGLLSSDIWMLAQDSSGYLWIAMDKGVARYDGYDVYNYPSANIAQNGLTAKSIRTLFVDSKNNLWIGSNGEGAFLLDREQNRFINYSLTDSITSYYNSNKISEFAEDNDGNLWAITFNGIVKINKDTKETTRFLTNENEEIIYRSAFVTIAKDKYGLFWITDGYSEGQLICFDPIKEKLINRYALNENASYGLDIFIRNNRMYIGSTIGYLLSYSIDGYGEVSEINSDFIGYYDDGILSIAQFTEKKLLLGTFRNLFEYRIDERKFKKVIPAEDSEIIPTQTSITKILKDIQGNFWIATDESGVGKISAYKNPFTHIESFPDNSKKLKKVYGLEIDNKNNVWMGTTSGLISFNQAENKHRYFSPDDRKKQPLSNSIISSILQASDEKIYLATIGDGLLVYNPLNENLEQYKFIEGDSTSLNWDYTRSLFESTDGTLWIGSFGSGIEKFDRSNKTFYNYKIDFNDSTSINARRVFNFAEDSKGNLWIASMMSGVDYFDRAEGIFKHFVHNSENKNSISSNNINSLYLEGDSVLWIGTNASGLDKYLIQKGKFVHYTTDNGLLSNSISSIVPAANGNLWISTSNGISEFSTEKETFRNFNRFDGIKNSEFTPSSYSVDDAGFIYFGGDNGVTKFHPDSVQSYVYSSTPIITKFSVIDKTKDSEESNPFTEYYFMKDEMIISSNDDYFSIEFSALDFVSQNKIRYAYKLEGFQEQWIKTNYTNRIATYTDLPPGDYIFRLAILDDHGKISSNQIQQAIIITPMFYETFCFYLLIALVLIALGYLFYRMKMNKIRDLENLRLKIASDLHDEVGSTLTKVSMRAQMLEMQINGEKEAKNLQRISEQARDAVSTMQDIVWAIDSRNDEAVDLLNKIKDTAFNLLAEKNIEITFKMEGIEGDNKLPLNVRQNVYLIMKEALHNVTKHSNAKNVSIILKNTPKEFQMIINDDGTNFKLSEQNVGQGLNNMKMRAEKIGGKLEYYNGKGFTIKLVAPPIN